MIELSSITVQMITESLQENITLSRTIDSLKQQVMTLQAENHRLKARLRLLDIQ